MSWNLMTWFSFWTFYEIVMYSLFITSVLLRLTLSANDFFHARMVYSLTLGLFIINSMQFFLVSKHIGPKVIMIGRMVSLNIICVKILNSQTVSIDGINEHFYCNLAEKRCYKYIIYSHILFRHKLRILNEGALNMAFVFI